MSLSWALFLLGHHPEVQEKIHQEQQEIFHDPSELPSYKTVSEMNYLDRVIKESGRVYPTVVKVARRITHEFEVGGYTIPVGANIGLILWGCTRDERFFPEPDKFDPDRWLPEHVNARHIFASTPFSAGPRNCVGQRYAQLQMKTILSMMVRRYKIKSVDSRDSVKVIPGLVAKPFPTVRLTIEKRK